MTIEVPNGFAGPLTIEADPSGRVLLTARQGHQADGRIAVLVPLDREQTAALLAALHRAAEVAWPEANEAEVVPRACHWCGCEPGGCDCQERIDCQKAGTPGHSACGTCPSHSTPRFRCGCRSSSPSVNQWSAEDMAHRAITGRPVLDLDAMPRGCEMGSAEI